MGFKLSQKYNLLVQEKLALEYLHCKIYHTCHFLNKT